MQMVILAGGLGTRMRPVTEKVPKSMLLIQGKPFLEYQIDLLRRNGVTDIVLCVGYLAGRIKEYFSDGGEFGVRIRYSEEEERLLGMAGALKKAEPLLWDECLAMNGDSYLPLDYVDVMSYFKKRDKLGLMVVYENRDRFDKSNVVIEGELVKTYDRNRRCPGMIYIDAGFWALRKKALALIPPQRPVLQDEFFHELVGRNELLAWETRQRFYEIGSFRGLEEFGQFVGRG